MYEVHDDTVAQTILAIESGNSIRCVAKRISKLEEYGLIKKENRGKYRITENGTAYLQGDLDASSIDPDD
jgi:predicted transcriptional regulator